MHIPTTPKDSTIKPNPHPYAIRTTSTGILTRSNSSGHNTAVSRHHYIPLSSSSKEVRKRHRYTKSLTQELTFEIETPSPLPVPSTFTGNARGQSRPGWNGSIRSSRLVQDSVFLSAATLEELPSNPKLWTTSQLSVYLGTALRVPTDDATSDSLAVSDVAEIIAFVKESNINGRIFLRLIGEDLDKYVHNNSLRIGYSYLSRRGITPAWRDALLAASRNLRQNVIKGRIWGGDADFPETPSPTLPSHPFSSALYNSSSSSIDLTDEEEDSYKQRRRRRGRVYGMVQSFERSGSFSSESSVEEDSEDRKDGGLWLQDSPSTEEPVLMSPVDEPLPLAPPPINVPTVEEPTVEALLAETDISGTWGARAWEAFDVAPGVTVKRVEESPACDSDIRADTISRLQTMAAFGSARSAKSVRLPKGKQDRRVITAIFAPPVPETVDDTSSDAVAPSVLDIDALSDAKDPRFEPAPTQATTELQEVVQVATPRELDLEAELAETRALVHAFRVRLEDVERRVADLEAEVQLNEEARHKLAVLEANLVNAGTAHAADASTDGEPDYVPGHETDTSTLLEVDDDMVDDTKVHRPLDLVVRETQARGAPAPDPVNDPSTVSELPHYVLLVGLGVCAVVLRVIVRRAAGRGAGFSWRL